METKLSNTISKQTWLKSSRLWDDGIENLMPLEHHWRGKLKRVIVSVVPFCAFWPSEM